MRRRSSTAARGFGRAYAVLACGLLMAAPARAQSPAAAGSGSGPSRPFLAVDVFGGAHPQTSTSTAPNAPAATYGWEIAATVRPLRWFGIAAAVGRVRTPERHWIDHVQIGPRVSRPLGRATDVRVFAHVLAGRASSRLLSGGSGSSLELMAGGGLDLFNVFRFQLDAVRRDLATFPRADGRFLFGVAIPICFRGCAQDDGFAVDARRSPRVGRGASTSAAPGRPREGPQRTGPKGPRDRTASAAVIRPL